MTTSGASNNLLGIRRGVGNGGGFTYALPELIYTSKGGNEWAVNYNAIMEVYRLNTGNDHFIIQGKNVGATNNITFNYTGTYKINLEVSMEIDELHDNTQDSKILVYKNGVVIQEHWAGGPGYNASTRPNLNTITVLEKFDAGDTLYFEQLFNYL